MEENTLTALSQREAAFWLALAFVLVGSMISSTGGVGDTLVGLGLTILVVRVLVAFYRVFRTSAIAGKIGYGEGKHID
jgi:hypothetical protein